MALEIISSRSVYLSNKYVYVINNKLINIFVLFQMIQEGNNAILLISTTYEEDSGTFSCRATSSAGQVEQSAKLIVKSKK